MTKERPIGVTILAILALIGALNAFIYTLQMLHIIPVYIGSVAFFQFSLIGAIIWGFLVLVWLGVAGMLMQLHPSGYMFMYFIAIFNLIYGIVCVLGASSWEAMAPIIIISALVLL